MTEMGNGMSQSTDTTGSQPVISASTPAAAPQAPTQATTSEERSFRQSEVTDIVKRAKQEAVDSFRRMQVEQPNYVQQKYGESAVPQQPQPSVQKAAETSFTQEDVRRMAAEEAQRMRDQWINDTNEKAQVADAQRMVQEFWTKVSTGREKYQDFDQVTGNINYVKFPNVVQLLARHIDNSDSVLYELGKNRIKMANLEWLAERSPEDAIIEANALSKSIKDNEAAGKMRFPNAPLSQLRPSNTGTDNGAMSVGDYRKKYKV